MEYIEIDDRNMPGELVDFTNYASSHRPMVHGPLVVREFQKIGDGWTMPLSALNSMQVNLTLRIAPQMSYSLA